MMKRLTLGAAVLLALTGCANLAPDFERPATPVPDQWPALASTPVGQGKALAEVGWQDFFTDDRLKQVITQAVQNNRDLRVAALNIEKARAQYQISSAARFPAINLSGAQTAQRPAEDLSPTGSQDITRQYTLGLGFAGFELDFFNRVGNLKDQALEQYLATEDAQAIARISLIAEVANTWLTLAADQERLRLARATYDSQKKSLALIQRSFDLGVSSALDLNQSRMAVESARADAARYTAIVAQDRNALNLLAGAPVPDALIADALTDVAALTEVPAGVPSESLLRRPDVVQSERLLRAANASIGAARAAFFPRITLTASGGFGSRHLGNLFDDNNGTWTFMPQIVLPIFNAGSNQAALDSARAEQKIRIAQYEKAIPVAFRETADALSVRATVSEQLDAQQALLAAATESFRLSEQRFDKGIDSYLPVLDSQRSQYAAQQGLIAVKLARQSNAVTLYKVFGGGWLEDKKEGGAGNSGS